MSDSVFPAPPLAEGPPVLLGTSAFGQDERSFPVYDAYWEGGGRAFDTAWLYGHAYGPGCCERSFGAWTRSRGLEKEVWVLAKGAHTPECLPDRVEGQLTESLERMQRDGAALYMLHRDNPEVPVGEFVTVLADLVVRGVIGGYGMSNWPLERVREAVAYARTHGLVTPSGVSNQFSLIDMVHPIYPGTETSNDRAWRTWLAEESLPLYPWASQGRGAHALADPGELRTGPLAESWYSEANEQRLLRAREFAAERGISSTGVALAWTLSQPFPVVALIGPRQPEEVRDSLTAASYRLTGAERDWLETGTGTLPTR
ncbi:aldo/keto reductase [Streptomyces antarcticus]|uniref:aldo/keto reductase n=1 Tax=Streptomyces antarcticus TaxID=2996458 RepID=UPI0022712E4D|nr:MULTISPECIES: aldo/keto reductase [unclassified Streptomyces]MCY0945522.1 aldo/keto reductase [Streptomyces sp. H34-AA3]MCZ4083645.1 aldo/keto reductase [Streptomyces sp. H34-S5]